jgi:two-component system LytT family response regulator/two-component system response regulator LytT
LDYLLKPVERDRLGETIQRAQRVFQDRSKSADFPAAPRHQMPQRSKILVKNAGRSFIVDAQDIVYASIEDGLITIVTPQLEGESNYRTIEE